MAVRKPPPTLVRQVEVRHPVGSAIERRRVARRGVHGTLCRMLVTLALAPIVGLGLLAWLEPLPTAADDTRRLVRQFAFEAFPQWAAHHVDDACPRTLDELAPIIARPTVDAWGTPLEMRCGTGIRGAYIRSAGPDRRFETTDDITSND